MPVGATLVITKGSTGSLSVSGDSGAGIGGTYYAPTNELGNPNCGTVVIDGGTVTANGGGLSAGIGGALVGSDGGNGGNITINCLYFRKNDGSIPGTVIGTHVFY